MTKEEHDVELNGASHSYGVSREKLNQLNTDKDMAALKSFGGVTGLASVLGTDSHQGLDPKATGAASIEAHREAFGANRFRETPPKAFLELVWENLQDPIIILLCAAALVSTVLGAALPDQREEKEWIEGVAIWIAVIAVTMVGALNDYQKDQQFRKLNAQKDKIMVKVTRAGHMQLVENTEVVVGDLLMLDTGDKIIADGILVETFGLVINEAALTGESDPIKKKLEEDPWCRSGTQVSEGSGKILVVAVGESSEWGKTMLLVGEAGSDSTPLQDKLEVVAGAVGKVGMFVAAACFLALLIKWMVINKGFPGHLINKNGPVQFFLYAVTIVVVAVPEGLPLAVTISLAYSMKKMMKDNNFVRVLAACETMGGATAICSDKTGTLTENRMTVTEGWFSGVKLDHTPNPMELANLLDNLKMNIALNSKAFLVDTPEGAVDFVGNSTECALLMLMRSWGEDYEKVRKANEKNVVKLYGFSSAKKMASVLVRQDGKLRLYNKGAAEWVLRRCVSLHNQYGEVVAMTEELREELMQVVTEMASRGLRCICLTYTDYPEEDASRAADFFEDSDGVDNNLIATCIVGIKDPVRKEVPAAVATCQKAGIRVRMVTGDNIHTAKHIARECGILTDGIALEGPSFRVMPESELLPLLPKLQVLARSSPEDKLILVRMLKQQGEVVAVTGDGTNDAPALKESDVGLAMGIAGTEVAKEAADIVIMDDNFSSIVKSVLWGRSVFNNIRKFLQFQLTVNFVALVIAFVGALIGGRVPLNVLQLLWVNLIMDTMGALALATETPNPELLDQKPNGRDEPLINRRMWKHILVQGFYQMFWMFLILYGLPLLKNPRYQLTGSCDYYSSIDSGRSKCVNEGIEYFKWNQTYASTQCQVFTSCGYECGSKTNAACPLLVNGTAPDDATVALCGNSTSCTLSDDYYHLKDHMHEKHEKFTEEEFKMTGAVLFNSFIFMQMANEINARRINDELNVFDGILSSPIFLAVILITALFQAIIINFLGFFFKVVPLNWTEWLVTMAIGAGAFPVSFITRLITQIVERRQKAKLPA